MSAKKGSFYTDKNIYDLRQRFLDGESVKSIRIVTKMTRETIYNYTKDLVPFVKNRPKAERQKSIIDRDLLLRQLADGMSYAMIGRHYDMTRQAITMYIRRNPLTDTERRFVFTGSEHS